MSILKNKKLVVIIDYQMSNLFSVVRAIEKIGHSPKLSSNGMDLIDADAVILPGVGAFNSAMENLHKLNLIEPIKDYIDKGGPFMGVCLGLQLLFEESEEFGTHSGLGIIDGRVKKFKNINGINNPVPQIGWNKINQFKQSWISSPLNDFNSSTWMYFVHSFYVVPKNQDIVLSKTSYCGLDYCSSINMDNVFATQFHPEKSGELGLKIYDNWLK
jgi:glutamine amidotransferase